MNNHKDHHQHHHRSPSLLLSRLHPTDATSTFTTTLIGTTTYNRNQPPSPPLHITSTLPPHRDTIVVVAVTFSFCLPGTSTVISWKSRLRCLKLRVRVSLGPFTLMILAFTLISIPSRSTPDLQT